MKKRDVAENGDQNRYKEFFMSQNFGVSDTIYYTKIYDRINQFVDDIDFYLKLCKEIEGSVLELCCGTGRITLPLRKSGIDITGLDFTPSMLKRAREKSQEQGLDCNFLEGDMRDFELDQKFDLIFIPFNSLLNTYTFDDINAIFSSVKKHLKPNGRFAFDIFNPNLNYLRRDEQIQEKLFEFTLDTGEHVMISQSMKYDRLHQVNRVKWHHNINGEEFVAQLDMRCFFPQEMDAILRYSNFNIVHKFGDFDRGVFIGDSEKQIYVCTVIDT